MANRPLWIPTTSVDEFPTMEDQLQLLVDSFAREYKTGETPLLLAVPYRICPLGAHVDHQGGAVLGRTINANSILAFTPLDEPVIRLKSENYPGSVEVPFSDGRPPEDWSRYAWAAIQTLKSEQKIERGWAGIIHGPLPGGGLSSSSSAGLAYLHALAHVNGLDFQHSEYIELDRILENRYMGLSNGILDQSMIELSRPDALLHLDTRKRQHTYIPDPTATKHELTIMVIFSGQERGLVSSGYNQRVNECRKAVSELASRAGITGAEILSDIPEPVFQAHKEALPAVLHKRARHYFSEVARVERGREAWAAGDWETFGRLMNESGHSSVNDYESGSQCLIQLDAIARAAPGVFGCRFSGGGFGGAVTALVDPQQAETAAKHILQEYLKFFPEMEGAASCHLAEFENGVRLL